MESVEDVALVDARGGWRRENGSRGTSPTTSVAGARVAMMTTSTSTFAAGDRGNEEEKKKAKKAKKKEAKKTKPYPESRSVTVNGERYRRCAAAIVFNSKGQVLCGERSDRPGSWNMPQGGIEKKESVESAASRELFEETGLRSIEDDPERGVVSLLGALPEDDGYCYRVDPPSWLTDRGLAGQRLEFVLFRWLPAQDEDAQDAESDPTSHPAVNLAGSNGESREFNRLAWVDFDALVRDVWSTKRGPYRLALDVAVPRIRAELAACPPA
jgi:putative (di)nucleoside polyphosphate hydrolase